MDNASNQHLNPLILSKTTAVSVGLMMMVLAITITFTWNAAQTLYEIKTEIATINHKLDSLALSGWTFQCHLEWVRELKLKNPDIDIPDSYRIHGLVRGAEQGQ